MATVSELTCYDQVPILEHFPLQPRGFTPGPEDTAYEGAPPLTGDGSQFDAPLDLPDPGRLLSVQTAPAPSDGRAFGAAAGLMVGLFVGFAGGFMVGQRGEPSPVPRSAAQAPAPAPQAQTAAPRDYTESPVAELAAVPVAPPIQQAPAVNDAPAVKSAPVAQALSDVQRRPLGSASTGSLHIVSRPSGAHVYLDDARVGTTPLMLSSVSAGSHRVRLQLPGYREWVTSVEVEKGTGARVGASLER